MKVVSKMIELHLPFKGIEKVILHQDCEKGWLIEFWYGQSLGMKNRYIVTRSIVLGGIFTAMCCVNYLPKSEYLQGTEEYIMGIVNRMKLSDFKQLAKEPIFPDGLVDLLTKVGEVHKFINHK